MWVIREMTIILVIYPIIYIKSANRAPPLYLFLKEKVEEFHLKKPYPQKRWNPAGPPRSNALRPPRLAPVKRPGSGRSGANF